MTGLRICLVVPGFPVDHKEPGLPAIVDLIERISSDHDVEIVALRHPTNRGAYELAGARIHPLGLGNKGGPRARGRILARGIRAVATLHRRRPVDLVHGLWADEAGAVATLAARWIGRPSIVSVMGGEFVAMPDIGYGAALGRGGRSTVRVSLRAADLITVPSGLIDGMVRPLVRDPEERLARLPLGVDTVMFRPAEHPPSTPTVVFAGSLAPVKDPETAIRAFAGVAASLESVRLVVAGAGGMRGKLEALARQLGVEDRIRFLGQVPRKRMAELFQSASLLCVTSLHELQSMVAVEAAACGLPVVGTAVGVLPDLGAGARLVPSGDVDALTAALIEVLTNRELAAQMSAAGRAAVTERYAIERTSSALIEHYRELISRRPDPPRES